MKKSVKLILEERLLPEVYFSRVDGLGVDPATLAVDISKTFYLGTQILGKNYLIQTSETRPLVSSELRSRRKIMYGMVNLCRILAQ